MSACFGLSAAEGAAGLPPERLALWLHPDDKARCSAIWQKAIETAGPISYRYRLRTEAGEFRWVQALGRCFADEAGRPVHLAGVLMDVSSPSSLPIEVEVIETLMHAFELAKLASDPVMPRLIEAVLLHAGRELARGLDPSDVA